MNGLPGKMTLSLKSTKKNDYNLMGWVFGDVQ